MANMNRKSVAAAAAVTAYLNAEQEANATVAIPAAIYHQLGHLYQQLHQLFGANDDRATPPNSVI